jgi:HD-GYP domain-containing protein (c-di-GMP phosphodiesterase class II)
MDNRLDLESSQFRQRLIRTLIQSTPAAYILIDKNFHVRFASDFLLQNRKWEKGDVIGEVCYDISNNGVPCNRCVVRDAIESGRPRRLLRKDVMHDGSVTFSDDFALPIGDKTGDGFDYILEIMIDRTHEMQIRERNNVIFLDIIDEMLKLLEKKDFYTCMHSRNVSTISAKLTHYYGLGDHAVFNAALGGLLHDLGKLYIPDDIIHKPSKLDDKEYQTMKEHPLFTWLLLTGLTSFNSLRDVAIAHHERWDGKGYPNGLSGDQIPIEARITALADTYDAMTSTRPYRTALPHEYALEELQKFAGIQFDPQVVAKFIKMISHGNLDREALIAPIEALSYAVEDDLYHYAHYHLHHKEASEEIQSPDDRSQVEGVMQSDSFFESIINNTPAFYTVIDDAFNVLYVSENLMAATGKLPEKLIGTKCFDMTDKKMRCFQIENDHVLCPVVRAFATGEKQYALIEEDFLDQKLYFDVFAIPIELENKKGKKIKCCLEIMFDRTREKNIQRTFESDLKQLIVKISDMVEEILPDVSANVHEIVQEANNFSEYLDNIKTGLSELVSSSDSIQA